MNHHDGSAPDPDRVPGSHHDAPGGALDDEHRADSQDGWADHVEGESMPAPRRPLRLGRSGRLLLATVVAAGGFVGGVVTTQQVEEASASSGLPDGIELPEGVELPDGFQLPDGGLPSAVGAGGGNLPFGGTDADQTYTVTLVDRSAVYAQDAAGQTIKIVLADGARIRTLQRGTIDDLDAGDQIVVAGDSEEQGRLRARRITEAGQ